MPPTYDRPRQGRGSSYDRRRRREWLAYKFSISPKLVVCFHCGKRMSIAYGAWEVDRYPVKGRDGGTYRRSNIVIACVKCNHGDK